MKFQGGKQTAFLKSKNYGKIKKSETYHGFFDGCSKNNPGSAGIGYFIADKSGKILIENSVGIGTETNNSAEYYSLLFLLFDGICHGIKKFQVYGDSELIIKNLKGIVAIKHDNLKYKSKLAQELLQQF